MLNTKVTLATGEEVPAGTYIVNYTSLRLFVTPKGAVLSGRTRPEAGCPRGIDFQVPVRDLVGINPEDAEAREKVLDYLSAGWPHRLWPRLNVWMEEREDAEGMSIWQKYLIYGQNLSGELDSDVNRPLVEQEVTAWLNDQTQEQ